MSQQILFAGIHSDATEINVLWCDDNNLRHGSKVEIVVEHNEENRKRCLSVYVNGVRAAIVPSSQTTEEVAAGIARLIK